MSHRCPGPGGGTGPSAAHGEQPATTILLVLVVVLVRRRPRRHAVGASAVAIDQAQDRFYFFKRQLLGVGIGLLPSSWRHRIPYRVYRRLASPAFL